MFREGGVDLSKVTIQTNEFIGSWQQKRLSAFSRIVEEKYGAKHRMIPVKRYTFQSDIPNHIRDYARKNS